MRRLYFLMAIALLVSCHSKAQDTGFYKNVETTAALESKYLASGPESVKVVELPSADKVIGKIVVVYPESLETSDAKWPLVNIGNPSNTDADGMMDLLRHLASWGYIVVDNMDKQTGTGASVSKTLDEFLALSAQDGNLFQGKVDTDKMGIAGYSQGACAVALAATQYPNAGLYKAIYLCSCPQPQLGINFKWGEYHFADFKAPVLTFAGTGEWDSKIIAPAEVFTQTFDEIPGGIPAVQARRSGKDHEQMGGEGDPYMTAWFEYWLKNDQEAGKAFIGEEAELLHNDRWQDVRIKNF
ncbi:MAG: hypothetical protein IJ651_02625 [Bacteroidales bacterium]|nr:hypothetical protein [Bacteroidales bacterium]